MPDLVTDGDDLGNHVATKALLHVKALDVASADAITLTDRGNTFDITGTTTINHINTTNWGVGGMVILQFDGAVTLTHNAGSLAGSEGNMLLARNQNYTTTAGDILTFVLHDSTNWKEISRSNIITSVSTDTLTNKTIDADVNTISNLAIGSEVDTTLSETEEIWIPAGAFTTSTTDGAEITSRETTTNAVNYTYAGFDTTTSESAWFTWTPPANWNAGTVRFKLYWTNTAGLSTETIDFDLSAVAFGDDDALDTAVGTPQNVTDTFIAQDDLHISAYSSAITIAGSPTAGKEVHFKLSRDVASDDLTGDCDVIGVLLEFTINDIGTT